MASKTETRGFFVPCPRCGTLPDEDGEGGLSVRVHDLAVWCPGCEETVTRPELALIARDATRLLRWLDAAEEVDGG